MKKDGHIVMGLRGDHWRRLKLYRLGKTSWYRGMQIGLRDWLVLWLCSGLLPPFWLLLLLLLLLFVFNRIPLRKRITRRRRGRIIIPCSTRKLAKGV